MKDSQSLKKKQKKLKKKNKQQKVTTVFVSKTPKTKKSETVDQHVKPPPDVWEKSGIPKSITPTQSTVTKKTIFDIISLAKVKKVKHVAHAIKKYETDMSLMLIPGILLIILSIVSFLNNRAQNSLTAIKLRNEESFTKINPYPFMNAVAVPKISAKAAIITDANSQVILFSKNPDLRFSMASTTKIMTALVALDYFKKDSILTIKSKNVEGTTLSLQPGDKFYFEDLLYAMLLPSANDAAYNIAANYPGGVEAFVKKMNEKAVGLHLKNTHFADPIGLDDDGDYTNVVDMSRLASDAIKNPEFTKITSSKQKEIKSLGSHQPYSLNNLNKLLGIYGVNGIKTGTTEGAGEVLVTSTVSNGHIFIIVVMNSEDRFTDTRTLLGFIDQSVEFFNPQLSQ